jgi:flagellar basal body rod protein FlgG
MNIGMFQAAAAMNANARWQDVISSNLASGSVPGFKKDEVSFEAIQAGMMGVDGPNGANGFMLPRSSTSVNWRDGEFRHTGVNTDVAIEGPGFFEVQLPDGSLAYTRDGEFGFNSDGQLITKDGSLVLGDGGPFQMDLDLGTPLSISPTGEMSQGTEKMGNLKVVNFNDSRLLQRSGSYFFANAPELVTMQLDNVRLRPESIEGSNTSPMSEMTNLITSMRMFETNSKLLKMQDERMGKVIQDLSAAG